MIGACDFVWVLEIGIVVWNEDELAFGDGTFMGVSAKKTLTTISFELDSVDERHLSVIPSKGLE